LEDLSFVRIQKSKWPSPKMTKSKHSRKKMAESEHQKWLKFSHRKQTPKESTMSEIVTTHLVTHQIDETRYKLFLLKSTYSINRATMVGSSIQPDSNPWPRWKWESTYRVSHSVSECCSIALAYPRVCLRDTQNHVCPQHASQWVWRNKYCFWLALLFTWRSWRTLCRQQ